MRVEHVVTDVSSMSDGDAGECFIEYSSMDELTSIRLLLARSAGIPEPVLHEDSSPALYYGVDEDVLAAVVEIQLRMSTGSDMRKEAEDVIYRANHGTRLEYTVYIAWCERLKKIKAHWWDLKNQCDAVIKGDKAIWARYFQLKEEDRLEAWLHEYKERSMHPYFVTFDPVEIDEQQALFQTQNEVADELAASHILEQQNS